MGYVDQQEYDADVRFLEEDNGVLGICKYCGSYDVDNHDIVTKEQICGLCERVLG